jgi:outer membrane protein assembly factor BamA
MNGRWRMGRAIMVTILFLSAVMVRSGFGRSISSGIETASGLSAPEMPTFGVGHQLIIDSQEGRRGHLESGLSMHYNRVDGLYVQLGLDTDWKRPALLRLFARGGYAFGGEVWRYELGLERWLQMGPVRLTLGIRNYDLTYSEDEWLLPTVENSLAAFFFREDFMDYYRLTGTSFHLTTDLYRSLTLELAYLLDQHESLKRSTNWSLFGGDKKFRDNPPVQEGEVHSLLIRLGYDTRDDFMEPASGFLVETIYEKAGGEFGGDLDFDRALLDIRRYLYLTQYENLDLRFRLGSSSGSLPPQMAFDLGGLGSLRGYKHKEFRDVDRMVGCNLEYRLGVGRLSSGRMEDCQIIPFYDFGLAWSSNDTGSLTAGFDQLKARRLKTSVGIGFSTGADDRLRINLARRLDDRDEPLAVTVRIHRIF